MPLTKKRSWDSFTVLAAIVSLWMAWNAFTAATLSKDWGLIHDAPILQYTASMITKGYAPYRDIIEINLPFTYWLHMAAIQLLGDGDFAFRLFDLSWALFGALMIACLCWGSGTGLVGAAAAAYVVIHVANGAASMGQRDFLMTPFLLAGGFLAMYAADHGRRAWLYWLLSGIAIGYAASIKPIGLLLLPCMLVAFWLRERQWKQWVSPAIWMSIGVALPFIAVVLWLFNQGIWDYFREVMTNLVAAIYVPVEIKDWVQKSAALTTTMLALGFVAGAGNRNQDSARYTVIQAGLAYGLLHYLLQRKGFWYNLYPAIAFGLCALDYGLRGVWRRVITEGKLVLALLLIGACLYTSTLGMLAPDNLYSGEWQRKFFDELDLEVATAKLEVQKDFPEMADKKAFWRIHFFDYTVCAFFNYAYHQGWEPVSRFQHPYPLYLNKISPVMQRYREQMLRGFERDPPHLILVCKQSWPLEDGAVYRVIDGKDGSHDVSEFFHKHYQLSYQNGMYRIYARKLAAPVKPELTDGASRKGN